MLIAALPVSASGDVVEDPEVPICRKPVAYCQDGDGRFTENLGQWDSRVAFAARGAFGHALFTNDGVIYDVRLDGGGHRVKLTFEGGSSQGPIGLGDLGFPTNYLMGNDRASWVVGARSFEEVMYEDAWPGIDVRYRFHQDNLKYDLVLDPNADPSMARFAVEGGDGVRLADNGIDILLADGSSLRDSGLVAWYEDREPADVVFLVEGNTYGFRVDGDHDKGMVIDPVVMHSATFLGGTYHETINDVVVDGNDHIVLAGETSSSDFPVTLGAYQEKISTDSFDVFITKMDHNASRIIWSTFMGGWKGDFVKAITVDEGNHLYMTGDTWSGDWPITPGAYCEIMNNPMGEFNTDIYVTKLNSAGDEVMYSTWVGGTAAEQPYDVDVRDGRVAVGAYTISPDFPTTRGTHAANMGAAVVFTMDANLSRMESCYVWDGIASENVRAVAIDSNGDVTLSGWTGSPGFPTTPGAYQSVDGWPSCSFVARFSPDTENLLFCTLLGKGHWDFVEAIEIDDDLDIYLTGTTQTMGENTHPITPGAYDEVHSGWYEGWVTKMKSDGTDLIYSTFLGGEGRERIYDIALDSMGNVAVVGAVDSEQNFSLTDDAHDDVFSGELEGFITVLTPDLSDAVYSSFHGGTYEDTVNAVAVDAVDNYVIVGRTKSGDTPVTHDGFQTRYAGVEDAMVAVVGEYLPTSSPLSLVAEGMEGHINLTWLPPTDDNRYPVREYHVYRGLTEDDLRPHVVLGTDISYRDEEVEWGVTYHYAVYASNWKGLSPRSNIASAVSVIVPDPPYNLTARVEVGKVTLDWQAPNFTGGLPLLGFKVYRAADGGDRELIAQLDPVLTSFEDLEAENGTLYTYYVTAANDYGESRGDLNVTVLTMDVPTPPRGLAYDYGQLFIHLSWNRPLEDFGLPVTGYRVYRQTEDRPFELIGMLEVGDRSFNDTHVMVGQLYRYRVTAINAMGESLPTPAMDAMVRVPPGSPKEVLAVAHEDFVRITWSPPMFDGASKLLGYQVYLLMDGDKTVTIGGKNVADMADAPLVFLHDVKYDGRIRGYVVTAFNAEGEGPFSDEAYTSIFQVPGAPKGLDVVWGDGTLTLEWSVPETDGGTAITSFTVYRQAEGESTPTRLVMVTMDTLGYLDDTVKNGVGYTYTVTATNLVGEGLNSAPVTGVPAGTADAPEHVAAEGEDGCVMVSWSPPAWDGGREVSGYRVFSIEDGTNAKEVARLGPEDTQFLHEDLVNGKVYVYAVRATTPVGDGELSGFVEARPTGRPSEPLDAQAFWTGDQVLVTWDVPSSDGGSPVMGFMVRRSDWDEGNWTRVTDPSFTDLLVEPGGTYNYTILAYNAVGEGPGAQVNMTVPLEEEPPVQPEAFEWTYLVLVVVVLALASAVAYMTLRKGRDDDDDGRK
ncbi:MAG: fibronectin type III domain-containing protein [Thermoplasmata archaeon]|nr:MAG: fibronectin type III domain-containing protein [Thermoplasmata archaeon]